MFFAALLQCTFPQSQQGAAIPDPQDDKTQIDPPRFGGKYKWSELFFIWLSFSALSFFLTLEDSPTTDLGLLFLGVVGAGVLCTLIFVLVSFYIFDY